MRWVRAATGSVPQSLANPCPSREAVLPNIQEGQPANFRSFLPDILSATAAEEFVAVTTLPVQLGAIEYNGAGTLAAFNTALLD